MSRSGKKNKRSRRGHANKQDKKQQNKTEQKKPDSKEEGASGTSKMFSNFVASCNKAFSCARGASVEEGRIEEHPLNSIKSPPNSSNGPDAGGATFMTEEEIKRQEVLEKLRSKKTNDDCDDDDDAKKVEEAEAADEEEHKYVFFWKNQDIYSQWHKSSFVVGKQRFVCAEQYMMFSKADLFQDGYCASSILQTSDPSRMKKLGRQVRGFSEKAWDLNCLHIVKIANLAKFKQNQKLKEELFSTYPKVLVEASPYDRIWGIGLTKENPLAWNENTWEGKNYLGFIITEVRDELMCEEGLITPDQKQIYVDQLMAQICLKWNADDSDVYGSSVDPLPYQQYQADPYQQAQEKYEYFWKERDVYSQWYDSFFEVDGQYFMCAEQYMMYKKAETFGDDYIQQQVMEAGHPSVMKKLGRRLYGKAHTIWHRESIDVVKRGNIEKFSQHESLKETLFSTYPKILVEASPYDKKWGIGLEKTDPRAWDEATWQGDNRLGYILTEVRDELMWQEGIIPEQDRKVYLPMLKGVFAGTVSQDTDYGSGRTPERQHELESRTEQEEGNTDNISEVHDEEQGVEENITKHVEGKPNDTSNINTEIQGPIRNPKDISEVGVDNFKAEIMSNAARVEEGQVVKGTEEKTDVDINQGVTLDKVQKLSIKDYRNGMGQADEKSESESVVTAKCSDVQVIVDPKQVDENNSSTVQVGEENLTSKGQSQELKNTDITDDDMMLQGEGHNDDPADNKYSLDQVPAVAKKTVDTPPTVSDTATAGDNQEEEESMDHDGDVTEDLADKNGISNMEVEMETDAAPEQKTNSENAADGDVEDVAKCIPDKKGDTEMNGEVEPGASPVQQTTAVDGEEKDVVKHFKL